MLSYSFVKLILNTVTALQASKLVREPTFMLHKLKAIYVKFIFLLFPSNVSDQDRTVHFWGQLQRAWTVLTMSASQKSLRVEVLGLPADNSWRQGNSRIIKVFNRGIDVLWSFLVGLGRIRAQMR